MGRYLNLAFGACYIYKCCLLLLVNRRRHHILSLSTYLWNTSPTIGRLMFTDVDTSFLGRWSHIVSGSSENLGYSSLKCCCRLWSNPYQESVSMFIGECFEESLDLITQTFTPHLTWHLYSVWWYDNSFHTRMDKIVKCYLFIYWLCRVMRCEFILSDVSKIREIWKLMEKSSIELFCWLKV
jgi:hypothetical protein